VRTSLFFQKNIKTTSRQFIQWIPRLFSRTLSRLSINSFHTILSINFNDNYLFMSIILV